MLFDYDKISIAERYKLMAGSIIPRPIAWIVTKNSNDTVNIAPFSYFTGLSSNPATLIVSIGHKSNLEPKDTLKNIRENKKCTLCLVSEEDLELMHFSSKELKSTISEAEVFNIQTLSIQQDFPPAISSSPIVFFCELYKEIDMGNRVSFNPVSRLGGEYAFLSKHIKPPIIP